MTTAETGLDFKTKRRKKWTNAFLDKSDGV